MTTNQIAFWNLEETKRANRAREAELNRHQLADESIRTRTNDVNLYLGNLQNQLGKEQLLETVTANRNKEKENTRSNRASEDIRRVSNLLTADSIAVARRNAEINAINAATSQMEAATHAGQLVEANRTNLANEAIKQANVEELQRSNLAREQQNRFDSAVSAANQGTDVQTRQQTQRETSQHNRTTERYDLYRTYLDSLRLQNDVNLGTARTNNDFLQTINQAARTAKSK